MPGMAPSQQRVLHAAANLATSSPFARDLAVHLSDVAHGVDGPHTALLGQTAAAAGISPQQLLQAVASDPIFVVKPSDRGDDSIIGLSTQVLVQRAKAATATGILVEELPAPAALVGGKHPVRPGQPECRFFQQYGSCNFHHRCVFNHSPAVYEAHQRRAAASAGGLLAQGLAPRSISVPAAAAVQQQSLSTPAAPALQSLSVPAQRSLSSVPATPAVQSLPARPALPQRPGQPACVTFMLRGVCSSGASCRFDHPPSGMRQVAAPPPQPPPPPPPPPLQEQQQQQQQQRVQPEQPLQASAAASETAPLPPAPSAATAVASTSAAGVSSAPAAAPAGARPSAARQPAQPAAAPPASTKVFVPRLAGLNSDGLPLRLGAACCPYYTHTGTCKFRQGCTFTHPEGMEVPLRFAQTGYMAGRVTETTQVPYARLVGHLDRLWDYTSCPEAQMKTWVAKYLLGRANPSCTLWSPSAGQLAAPDDDPGAAGRSSSSSAEQRFGRYSCRLSDAGTFVSQLWAEQPGPAGDAPKIQLRALLNSDPYFKVLPDPANSSHMHVKLEFNKIKKVLNW